MGGQFAYMMPKYDTVLVTTADTQAIDGANETMRFAHYRMLRSMREDPLPEDLAAYRELTERLDSLSLPMPNGKPFSPCAARVSGTTYAFDPNDSGFRRMRVDFTDDACTETHENRTGRHSFPIFLNAYGGFRFPEKYDGRRIGRADREYESLSAGAWVEENRFIAMIYAVDDYVGTLKMQFSFDGNELTVLMIKSAENFFTDYSGFLAGHAVKDQ